MQEIIKRTLRRYDMTNGVVLAAVSGGRDSMAMLHALRWLSQECSFALYAVHVNHGLREAATSEEKLVSEYAQTLQVPLSVIRVNVMEQSQKGESVEMAARRLRYEAFSQVLETLPKEALLATAHHMRDQAETVLLHLLRGSGTRGLCGIHPVRKPYIRPMLFVPYADIERYALENEIPYVDDESNFDMSYLRNRIRHCLLPNLREYNASIEKALSTTALTVREDEMYLRELASSQKINIGYKSIPPLSVLMSCSAFETLPVPLQKRLIRMALEEIGVFDIEEGSLTRSVGVAENGGAVQLKKDVFVKGGHTLQVYRTFIPDNRVVPLTPGRHCRFGPFQVMLEWVEGQAMETDAWTAYLSPQCLSGDFSVRTRKEGDRILYGFGHKKLSDAMIDERVPSCVRDHLPVFICSDEVVWAPMIRVATKFLPKGQESKILKMQVTAHAYDGGVIDE